MMMGGWPADWEADSLALFPSSSRVNFNLSTCRLLSPLLSCWRESSSLRATTCLSLALSLEDPQEMERSQTHLSSHLCLAARRSLSS